MTHNEYKRMLNKKLREFTPEEAREYYRLRYKSHTPKQRRAHKERGKRWAKTKHGEITLHARTHNNTVKSTYPDAYKNGDIDNDSLYKWLLDNKGTECVYCGGEGGHIDHIVPLARGGTHTFSNIQMVCRQCNFSKRDYSEEEFLAWAVRIANKLAERKLNSYSGEGNFHTSPEVKEAQPFGLTDSPR